MLKHIYSIPSIKVMSVDTEDILTNFSNAQEVTGGNLGENIGGGRIKDNTSTFTSIEDQEKDGAKGISFDFE